MKERNQDQDDLIDDEVEIDKPSLEEIKSALKYLKYNKVADADSIAAELLKNGGSQLVDTLETARHKLDQRVIGSRIQKWR
jgi:hypothetical protein